MFTQYHYKLGRKIFALKHKRIALVLNTLVFISSFITTMAINALTVYYLYKIVELF